MPNTSSVHSGWSAQNASYMGDVAGEIGQVGNDATEPVDTLALACAMAEAGEGLEKALGHVWALYTPQEAAVVASALHASMAAAVTNLRALSAAVKEVAARGDFAQPGPTGAFISVDDETPGDALDRLETVADEVEGHLGVLLPAISVLDAAPGLYRPASDVHGTMVAVAKALGPCARLHTPDIGHNQGASEDPCGCHIRIHVDGELYYFDLADMGWTCCATATHLRPLTEARRGTTKTGCLCAAHWRTPISWQKPSCTPSRTTLDADPGDRLRKPPCRRLSQPLLLHNRVQTRSTLGPVWRHQCLT
ncbi:hypothetical protein ACF08B_39035 [Streptomyces sp. NPDC015139]|uniref:hypothetical protein n=1 Tax=Streptomyces sp. NPDC015139 TaxID=3364942 RepID=UPI003702F5D3